MTDLAIVGLGSMGSAAAWTATKRGLSVVGFEQFELGHERGASHDTSRILRHSYHTPHYVGLTFAAYDAWAELEADSGISLVTQTGGIDFFPPDAAIDMSTYTSSMDVHGITYDVLDVDQVRERWPVFTPPEGTVSLYQARSSIVPAALGTATMQRLARERGAELLDRTKVEAIIPGTDSVTIVTSAGTYTAERVIVTADAWTADLIRPLGWDIPLTVTEEQITYVSLHDPAAYARIPLWIWMDDPSFYGFPCYGEPTMKAAEDCGGPEVTGDNRSGVLDPQMLARLEGFLRTNFSGIGDVLRSKRCLYTLTADRDFVLSTVPGHERVTVGLGAAHGFKFAPAFGDMLVDVALGGDIDPVFTLDRPGITDPNYEANWLV
ncbi:MAG: N-methyltryptophan oxidase [Actinomycetales bacterium mxb001]|nr:MAG: N-methyltryptophan oxidase [Actinomycetales bacterium mxb001]